MMIDVQQRFGNILLARLQACLSEWHKEWSKRWLKDIYHTSTINKIN